MNLETLALLFFRGNLRLKISSILLALCCLAMTACGLTSSFGGGGTTDTDIDYANLSQDIGEYRIGPEDVLEISVWQEDALQRKVLVRPDGGISFPLVGDLQAAGKTADELQREITEKLERFIPEPEVTVSVANLAGYRIYVLGQVRNPGQYVVGRYVDVLQALSLAGGLTPFASEDNIKIVRRENSQERVFPFSYSKAKAGTGLEQNIMLKPDDVVVVP